MSIGARGEVVGAWSGSGSSVRAPGAKRRRSTLPGPCGQPGIRSTLSEGTPSVEPPHFGEPRASVATGVVTQERCRRLRAARSNPALCVCKPRPRRRRARTRGAWPSAQEDAGPFDVELEQRAACATGSSRGRGSRGALQFCRRQHVKAGARHPLGSLALAYLRAIGHPHARRSSLPLEPRDRVVNRAASQPLDTSSIGVRAPRTTRRTTSKCRTRCKALLHTDLRVLENWTHR